MLLFKIAWRVLTRIVYFSWRGALTLFIFGMICGMATGLIHLAIGFLVRDQFVMQQPSNALFADSARLGIVGFPWGFLCYATAGAMSSRHDDFEEVLVSLNLWVLPYGLIGATFGYLNAVGYNVCSKLYSGRPFSSQVMQESLGGWSPDIGVILGFFTLTFLCAVVKARKAMREMDKR